MKKLILICITFFITLIIIYVTYISNISSAAKIDIRPRDYSVKILYKNKLSEEYDLWVSKDAGIRGTLMQGNKVWFIDKDSNSIFKDILK